MSFETVSAWNIRAFFLLGLFVCLYPGGALGAEVEITQEGIATYNATSVLTTLYPCEGWNATGSEVFVDKRNEFLAEFADSDIWCGQVLDFETTAPATITTDDLNGVGELKWTYTNVQGNYGAITAELNCYPDPLSANHIFLNEIRQGKAACPVSLCERSPIGCTSRAVENYSFLFIRSYNKSVRNISIAFSEPVGAVSIFLSALWETGIVYARLTHNDNSLSTIKICNTHLTTPYDATFFGAKVNDSDLADYKAIKKIEIIDDADDPMYIGIDDIFIATVDQALDTPPPPTEYGYPVPVIQNESGGEMNAPQIICTTDIDTVAASGSDSHIEGMDANATNSIQTWTWVLKDLADGVDGNTYREESYEENCTFADVPTGVYDLSLTVTDEQTTSNSTSVGVTLGDCECPDAGGSTRVVVIPLSFDQEVPQ